MFNSKLSSRSMLVAAVFTSMFTGCMVTPGNNENIGRTSDSISFSGFTEQPNRWVRIEALANGQWKTIGYARSGSSPIQYSGETWYAWGKNIVMPGSMWKFVGFNHPNGDFSAQVRARDYLTGNSLYAFDEGFYDWFDVNTSLADMWAEHGHGQSITIYSDFVPVP